MTLSAPLFRLWIEKQLPRLVLALFMALGSFGAFSGGMWGGVGIGLGILLFFLTAWLDHRWPRPSRDFLLLALVTLAVMALLTLGSSNTYISWYEWRRMVTIFVPLALLSAPQIRKHVEHRHFLSLVTLAIFIGAFALGIELVLDAPVLHITHGDKAALTNYNRGLSYLVILALPVMAGLWVRPLAASATSDDPNQIALPFANLPRRLNFAVLNLRKLAERLVPFLLFIAVMLFPTTWTESRAAKLAFVMALATVAVASIAPRLVRHALGALVILLLGWPLYVQKAFVLFQDRLAHLPASWRARVEIWDYMSYRIAERPWLGWGLGTSKTLDFQNPHGALYTVTLENAPHPHNVVTQLWVELGMPGLLLGLAFAFLTLRQAGRLSPTLVPFALGAWVAAFCLSLVAYNFWTDSLFAAFALTGFVFGLLDRHLTVEKP